MLLKIDHVKRRNGYGQLYIPYTYIRVCIGTVVFIRKRLMCICVCVIHGECFALFNGRVCNLFLVRRDFSPPPTTLCLHTFPR